MSRRRAFIVAAAIVGFVVSWATPAYADNCGSLTDCVNVLGAALGALAGALAAALGAWLAGGGGSSSPGASSGTSSGDGGAPSGPPPPGSPPGYPWLPGINPSHGTTNCVNTSNAVDDALGGNPHPAADSSTQPRSALDHGDHPWNYGTGDEATQFAQFGNATHSAGDGSRGYVWVERNGNGHVLNWVNNNGQVTFIDGQSGKTGVVDGPGGLDRFKDAVISNKADPTPLDFSWKQTYP